MSTRPMSAAMEAALDGDILYLVYFFEIGFASSTLRLFTGLPGTTYDWNGETWTGVGWLLGMSELEETTETKATSFTLGTPANEVLIATFLLHFRKNRPVTVWQGLKDPASGALLEDPVIIAAGFTDLNQIGVDPKNPTITVSSETRIADLERARVRRYTDEDHRIDWPEDRFFEYVGKLADKVLTWGQNQPG